MSTDLIRYDLLVQDALRSVVRRVLTDTARDGILGEHHYYITFRTGDPGVRLSARMRAKYPEEMTIILQHQFWDLVVSDDHFEVGLSFNNVAEILSIPFLAISGFFDPSVQFGLKFEPNAAEPETAAPDPQIATLPARRDAKAAAKPGEKPAKARPALAPVETAASPKSEKRAPVKAVSEETPFPAAENASPKVVSIDAFRKKP